jgi:uncharacterized protein (UPF0305 family)
MKKLSKKYKIYLSCLGILLIMGIVFTFYLSNQEKKTIEQKQNIEKYVDSIVDSEKNITNKLNNIKNSSISTIGDSDYIAEQIKNISDNNILLYNYQNDNIRYLDKYTKLQTDYDTYEQYYNHLNSKYNLNNYNNYNKTADKLINSAK